MAVETLRIPRNTSLETADGLRVAFSRLEGAGANRSPYIAASCVGLSTILKALQPGESLQYRDLTRSLAWQITLNATTDDEAVVQVATLPLKRVEWYELSEQALKQLLTSYYAERGAEVQIEFYKSHLSSFLITEPSSLALRSLEGAEARDEIVKIVFSSDQVLPWSVERKPDGGVRIGVIRGVASYAECVVEE